MNDVVEAVKKCLLQVLDKVMKGENTKCRIMHEVERGGCMVQRKEGAERCVLAPE